MLDERLEVVVDLCRVETDDPADSESEVLRLVRVVVEEFVEVEIGIVEQDVLDELVEIRLREGEACSDILEGGASIKEITQDGFDARSSRTLPGHG